MTDDLQSRWLGRMQSEIGVLATNLMLAEIQRDALAAKVAADAELIEALKARIQAAEDANRELRQQIQPVAVGQAHIQEQHIRTRVSVAPQPLRGGGGRGYLVSARPKIPLEGETDRLFIVDDQDFGRLSHGGHYNCLQPRVTSFCTPFVHNS